MGGAGMTVRESALALLNANHPQLNRKAGQFLGQIAVSPEPLTEKQAAWLATLLSRAGLPPLTDGGSA